MSTRTAPVKVDVQVGQIVADATYLLERSENGAADVAVCEHTKSHRAAIQEGVTQALRQLDGSVASSVALLTGMSRDDFDKIDRGPQLR